MMFLPRSPPALMAGSSDSCLFQKVFFTMTPGNFGNLTVKCCSKTLQTTCCRELKWPAAPHLSAEQAGRQHLCLQATELLRLI